MSKFYSFAYAVRFTPWEEAGQANADALAEMFAREEAERCGPGKALDLGCGTGSHTVELAQRGWQVTGVDLVDKAVERARKRIADAGVNAKVLRADLTSMSSDVVGTGYGFFLDLGCFHGLTPQEQQAMARSVTALANPEATLFMMAFEKPAGPRFMPQGATVETIEAAYRDWHVVDVEPAPLPAKSRRMLIKSEPTFFRLQRR
ncbi:class I SAM-dependent methyltransferase [Gordonia rhizosphera]|uniref:Methyltransferase domain-containing protein n=1 Tax=Gordonia rhizosphera NBRC 16068 TaxID=1108045 RepID=K6W948_9ACTN|nr:class I SAM-dependent methyltransferase [Gordonia rhizosphera]GAB90271.1 hypothetical protein GORHZ_092_00200 [Gordonia rhizosphera NBRC 16068]